MKRFPEKIGTKTYVPADLCRHFPEIDKQEEHYSNSFCFEDSTLPISLNQVDLEA